MNRTPRECLLERHAEARLVLDQVRLAALPSNKLSLREFVKEIFFPPRFIWGTLAVFWLLVAAFHFQKTTPPRSRSDELPRSVVICSNSNSQLDAFLKETGALQ